MIAPRSVITALALAALAVSAVLPARAGVESAGSRAATFLTLGDAPAVLGMGSAGLALGRDVQGAAWNPAALGWVALPQAVLAHTDFADQTSREWLAMGSRLGGSLTRVGFSVVVHDEGTIDGRDESGQPTGDLTAQDLALTLQLARPVGRQLALGGAVHMVNQRIGDVSGRGAAFDAGAQLKLGVMSFALAGQNFGGGLVWDHVRWSMPASIGAGMALEPRGSGFRLALDWNAPADYYRSLHAGAEWRWHDRLALRGGWRHELAAPRDDRLDGPSFGLGTGVGVLWLDYGYVLDGSGAATHRIAVSLRGLMPHPASPVPAPPADSAPPAEH